jgi:putative chitinase
MTQLSENFSLAEMTRTDTGLPNTPAPAELEVLRKTAVQMEAVRKLLGRPIRVNSAFRGPLVNKAVRGVTTSAHCRGHAVDFACPDFGTPFQVADAIARSGIKFDQLILEYGWVHISFDPRMRGECLTKRSAAAPFEQGIRP